MGNIMADNHPTHQSSPNLEFVSHSIQVLVAALTRPEMFESLEKSAEKLMFATSLVECLLCALLGKHSYVVVRGNL